MKHNLNKNIDTDFFEVVRDFPSCVFVDSKKVEINNINSYYYKKEYLQLEYLINNTGIETLNLKDLTEKISIGNTGKIGDCYTNQGIPYLTTKNTTIEGVDFRNLTFISNEVHNKLKSSKVYPNDILYNKSGNVGVAVIVPSNYSEYNVVSDLIIIRPKNIDSHYLCAFLNSNIGKKLSERMSGGAIFNHISIYDVAKLKIPVPDKKIQNYIGSKVRLAEKCRSEAKKSLEKAKNLLSKSIGFDIYSENNFTNTGKLYKIINNKPNCLNISTNLIGNSIGTDRYSTEALKKDEILKNTGIKLCYLSDISEDFINGYDCRDFQIKGTPYLKVANIKQNQTIMESIEHLQIKPNELSSKFNLKQGDLLITRKGSFGFCTTVTSEMENMLFSSEIIKVPLKEEYDSDYVALFLNSPFGRYQFDRFATGTTMKGINQENLAEIMIPIIDFKFQNDIGSFVRNFMSFTEKSKFLISEAKKDVEDLIEGKLDTEAILSGNLVAPTWESIEAEISNTEV